MPCVVLQRIACNAIHLLAPWHIHCLAASIPPLQLSTFHRANAQRQLTASAASATPVCSLLWALFSLQLFFCTGHFCEFAGLQYTAGASFSSTVKTTVCVSATLFGVDGNAHAGMRGSSTVVTRQKHRHAQALRAWRISTSTSQAPCWR